LPEYDEEQLEDLLEPIDEAVEDEEEDVGNTLLAFDTTFNEEGEDYGGNSRKLLMTKCWALTTFQEVGISIFFIRVCITQPNLTAVMVSTNQWTTCGSMLATSLRN
jgi:hypothetical protein